MPMQASPAAYAFIREAEGLRLSTYCCSAGKLTIGYGHTSGVKPGMTITLARAEEFLRQDVAECEAALQRQLKIGVNQNQFDALVSFVFNLGETHLSTSTMLKRINRGESPDAVAREFGKWVMEINPKTKQYVRNEGLAKRRAAEARLFASTVKNGESS